MSFGINEDLNYIELSLDSRDGVATTSQYSKLNWPKFRFAMEIRDLAAIKVLSAIIPFSYYVITAKNNTFTLTETGFATTLVTLPIGNYNANTLGSALSAALIAASITSGANLSYTVSYSALTGKFTITNNAGGATTFTLVFGLIGDTGATNPRNALGFNDGSITSVGHVISVPNVAEISGPNYLYVNSEKLGQFTSVFLPTGAVNLNGGNLGPQMCRVPIDVNPGDICYYNDPDPTKFFDLEHMNQLSDCDFFLSLGDVENTPLDLNGLPFSLKLGLLLYKPTRTTTYRNSVVKSITS